MARVAERYRRVSVLGVQVDVIDTLEAAQRITAWGMQSASRYVCAANAHMCTECLNDSELAKMVNGASLIVADGKSVVWAQRALGESAARHVRGMDLMLAICEAADSRTPIALFGADPDVLEVLSQRMNARYPELRIVCAIAPSYGAIEPAQNERYVRELSQSGARILFVALGCPKQECWMAANSSKINAVMVGVGAAFEFISGHKAMAPTWMQKSGLEWFFRLCTEPRRLWRRYLTTNPQFIWHFFRQWRGQHRSSRAENPHG